MIRDLFCGVVRRIVRLFLVLLLHLVTNPINTLNASPCVAAIIQERPIEAKALFLRYLLLDICCVLNSVNIILWHVKTRHNARLLRLAYFKMIFSVWHVIPYVGRCLGYIQEIELFSVPGCDTVECTKNKNLATILVRFVQRFFDSIMSTIMSAFQTQQRCCCV